MFDSGKPFQSSLMFVGKAKNQPLRELNYRCKSILLIYSGSWPGGPSKDPTVLLEGARPANTCIPPSSLRNVLVQPCGVVTQKYMFPIKKIGKFSEINFYLKIV